MKDVLYKAVGLDRILLFVSSLAFVFLMLVFATTQVKAVYVSPLPQDNLIINPWFRSDAKPNASGLDHWVDSSPAGLLWSTSQKRSNPTPDVIVSGKCGGSEQYCGTAARFASGRGQGGGGEGQSGVDAYLYQVVSANPEFTNLKFKTHWVTGEIEQATVTVYGSYTASGPWSAVWTPLSVNKDSGSRYVWTETELIETTLSQGWPYYKVELHGRYPLGTSQGVKYTGVYFGVASDDGSVITPTPSLTPTPTTTAVPTPTPTIEPTPNPDNTAPVLRTRFLAGGSVGAEYSYTLTGYDYDLGDSLTMLSSGLPDGLSIEGCTNTSLGSQVRAFCDLTGVPTQAGSYQVTITIVDQAGAIDYDTFNLNIN